MDIFPWTFLPTQIMDMFSMDIFTYRNHGHVFTWTFKPTLSWTFFSMDIFTYTNYRHFFDGHFYLHKSWTFFPSTFLPTQNGNLFRPWTFLPTQISHFYLHKIIMNTFSTDIFFPWTFLARSSTTVPVGPGPRGDRKWKERDQHKEKCNAQACDPEMIKRRWNSR